jgi:hypothetical protein
MMGGVTFILLKPAAAGGKSAKQAEIHLAILLRILSIARPHPQRGAVTSARRSSWISVQYG